MLIYLLPTHLIQSSDLGLFPQVKNHYNKNLKSYVTQGKVELNRAQFNFFHQENKAYSPHRAVRLVSST
jgi:hypothetical protein